MRQLERRRVRKLLDAARTKRIKLTREDIDFLWNINNYRKKTDEPLSVKQEKWLTDLWDRHGREV